MTISNDPTELIASLDPEAIRFRLAELNAGESALRVLLCAALARTRRRDKRADERKREVSDEK
jgi:hypothetical protein